MVYKAPRHELRQRGAGGRVRLLLLLLLLRNLLLRRLLVWLLEQLRLLLLCGVVIVRLLRGCRLLAKWVLVLHLSRVF